MTVPSDDELKKIYEQTKTIAVVGASADEYNPSHRIPRYIQSQGFRVIPVSPKGGEILGEKVYATLSDVDVPIDLVNVFRPSEETPAIAEETVKVGAKALWLQSGIHSDEAERIAKDGGVAFVSSACIGVTHGRLGLGPGPH
jgi:predicted CoA-binding protein